MQNTHYSHGQETNQEQKSNSIFDQDKKVVSDHEYDNQNQESELIEEESEEASHILHVDSQGNLLTQEQLRVRNKQVALDHQYAINQHSQEGTRRISGYWGDLNEE